MRQPCSTSSRRTTRPCGPVWCVTSVAPSSACARLGRVLHQLDAARLAAAARVDLRLHHAREAEPLGGRHGLLDREAGLAVGHGHAVAAEPLLGLVLVDVHPWASTLSVASTSSRTCEAETASACFSSGVSAISKTFSTPPAPICTGTPT